MNSRTAAVLLGLSVAWGIASAETVYKYDGPDGTTYSDRPQPDATSPAETVQLPTGPSAEEQRAAEQRVQRMQDASAEMEESRLATQQAREQQEAVNASTAAEPQAAGSTTTGYPRDPKTRIPIESPDGGEHPIYTPGQRPGDLPSVPRPPVAAPARGR